MSKTTEAVKAKLNELLENASYKPFNVVVAKEFLEFWKAAIEESKHNNKLYWSGKESEVTRGANQVMLVGITKVEPEVEEELFETLN